VDGADDGRYAVVALVATKVRLLVSGSSNTMASIHRTSAGQRRRRRIRPDRVQGAAGSSWLRGRASGRSFRQVLSLKRRGKGWPWHRPGGLIRV
jgi:hypothetical protein